MPDLLVLDLKPVSASQVRAIDRHDQHREPDGTSAIDLERTRLNCVLHGSEDGPSASLKDFYASGVRRPAKQAESPYLSAVLSASGSYFRPENPDAAGTWDEERLAAWRDRSMAWLQAEFGDDLVHVALHLDETTPHLHALIAPTYEKKKRMPGRRKKSETEADFQERRRIAQEDPGVRTVGRSSHEALSERGSFHQLRTRLAVAVANLGIEYGEDRSPDAPPGMSTAEWVRQQAVDLRRREAEMDVRRDHADRRDLIFDQVEADLDAREEVLDRRARDLDQKTDRLRSVYQAVRAMIGDVADRLGVGHRLRDIRAAIEDADFGDSKPCQKGEDSHQMDM